MVDRQLMYRIACAAVTLAGLAGVAGLIYLGREGSVEHSKRQGSGIEAVVTPESRLLLPQDMYEIVKMPDKAIDYAADSRVLSQQ